MKASNLLIRRLTHEDAEAFKRVRLRGLSEHEDFFTSSVADWDVPLENFITRLNEAYVIGAFDRESDTLLGHMVLAVHANTAAKTRHKCELWSVYVIPEARGRGAARALAQEAIETARKLGYSWLKLQVAAHNKAACQLYESLGFKAFGLEPDYLRLPDGRSIDEVLMQLRL